MGGIQSEKTEVHFTIGRKSDAAQELALPPLPAYRLPHGETVEIRLPEATGGRPPYEYSLTPDKCLPGDKETVLRHGAGAGEKAGEVVLDKDGKPITVSEKTMYWDAKTRVVHGVAPVLPTAGTTLDGGCLYRATDQEGTAVSRVLNITVVREADPPTPALSITAPTTQITATVGTRTIQALPGATGGTPEYTYTLQCTVPDGETETVKIVPTTALPRGAYASLDYKPTQAGDVNCNYLVTDKDGQIAATTFTFTVGAASTLQMSGGATGGASGATGAGSTGTKITLTAGKATSTAMEKASGVYRLQVRTHMPADDRRNRGIPVRRYGEGDDTEDRRDTGEGGSGGMSVLSHRRSGHEDRNAVQIAVEAAEGRLRWRAARETFSSEGWPTEPRWSRRR